MLAFYVVSVRAEIALQKIVNFLQSHKMKKPYWIELVAELKIPFWVNQFFSFLLRREVALLTL